MELEKWQEYAKAASKNELKVLEKLEDYYKGECSFGYASEHARIPLRALMDFMEKYELPYNWDANDAKEGLKKISRIRSML